MERQEGSTVTEKKHVTIQINGKRYKVSESALTGREIAALAKIPEGSQIFLEVRGPAEDRHIGVDEVVELKSGMKFYDVPIGNLG